MTTINMPQLGETVVEGTILKWLKKEGETVAQDEPLFEISTDKVDTEVPSPAAGTVTKILVPEGQTVGVGTPLAEVDAGDGQVASGSPAASAEAATEQRPPSEAPPGPEAAAPVRSTAPVETPPQGGPRSQVLSPLVRRLAAEHDVDLSQVQGTGTGGRITKSDVMAFVASGANAAAPRPAPSGPTAMPARQPAASQPAAVPAMPTVPGDAEEVQPISHIRRTIAQHMLTSTQQTARAWTMVEVNVDHLVKLRERAKDAFGQKHGVKLTYLPFVVRATVDALQEYPQINGRLDGDNIVLPKFVNMGIAVSYDAGLIVPVIKGADAMNTVGIARAIADLAARARAHQLTPDEVQGATFTITNPGPYGSVASVPIINQPNTGILSLDAIVRRPVVIEDAIAIRSMVNISMSWDHRTIDGELATRFLARVKQNLESWDFAEDLGV
ncbi:MAG TPA: dihydrolipoamide acetyltransferase family protein [Actinomycetota bacterium]|nr:dihydrolipoamide acetyltransferase family protein [Actinomycetota bacterium]